MNMTNRKRILPRAACALVLLALLLCTLLCGCGAKYEVSFDLNYEGAGSMEAVQSGKKLAEPVAPVREGYVLLGWFKDAALSEKWDFGKDKVTGPLTLYAGWDLDTGDAVQNPTDDKDFGKLRTPGSQESAYEYKAFFLPGMDGTAQPYVGDTMPYYEDGVFYIYYLKDGGDSYNHSIYLATTRDFVTWEEQDEPVLESSRSGGQDGWIGTGSVVKVNGKYYFFYTGHSFSEASEFKETIMLAESDNLRTFRKVDSFEIKPPSSLGQKNDFRDPQAYYDEASGTISLTVTAAQGGVARILKFTLSADLTDVQYDGIIFTNQEGNFWNLECSDTFQIGDTWYLTYSAQDDTLWYAASENRFGPYGDAKRMEGKLFYAAKHVEDANGSYMVGWARRSESVSSTQDVAAWAGNMTVQKIVQRGDGSLYLAPVDAVSDRCTVRRALALPDPHAAVQAGSAYNYADAFTCFESFKLTGEFTFTGKGSFGLAFDYNGRPEKNKLIALDPEAGKLQLLFNEGSTLIAETSVELVPGKTYSFTYLQEGSVGVFYLDGQAALTVRIYGASGKPIQLFAEQNTVTFTSLRQYTPGA